MSAATSQLSSTSRPVAVDLFETHDDFSFGDATTVAYMERADIEYLYSFDDDFDVAEGGTRLESPHSPLN